MKLFKFIGTKAQAASYGKNKITPGEIYSEDYEVNYRDVGYWAIKSNENYISYLQWELVDEIELKDEMENNNEKVKDNINPDHYKQGNIEVIDMIESATASISGFEGYCVGNIVKYVSRYNQKNGIEDLKKSKWYLEKLIKYLENGKEI
jgi:hypothetical protein